MVEQQHHATWHKQLQITHFFRMLCFNSAVSSGERFVSFNFFSLFFIFITENSNNITGKNAQSITVHFWRYISFSLMLEQKPEIEREKEKKILSTFPRQRSLDSSVYCTIKIIAWYEFKKKERKEGTYVEFGVNLLFFQNRSPVIQWLENNPNRCGKFCKMIFILNDASE